MRDIKEGLNDIENLVAATNLENDPTVPIYCKDLFTELREARGFITTKTGFPQCDMRLDKDDEWTRYREFRYEPDQKPEIIYTYPVC